MIPRTVDLHSFLLRERSQVPPEKVPPAGRLISIVLSLITLSIISICLSRRIPNKDRWGSIPVTSWLLIIIYVDSFIFVFLSAIIKDLGVNESTTLCQGAILLCLACYLTTKILIYLFLVEKAHIVRGRKTRRQDKLYIFNVVGLMVPYLSIAILNFIYRIGYINPFGRCIIGMEKKALMPLIIFDVVINIYLTILFLIPLRKLLSYQNGANPVIRTMAIRTFVGACCTTVSSVVNLTVLTVLDGEPGWICLLACNADVLFSVLVLHWITVTDKSALTATNNSYTPSRVTADRSNINHSNIDKRSAVISTRITTEHTNSVKRKDSNHDFPSDVIKVQKEYAQDVEMDAVSAETSTWSDNKRDDGRATSTDRIVPGTAPGSS